MSEAKLLACPFCGGNDRKLDEQGTGMNLSLKRVECKTCGAQTGTVHDHDYQAIKAWNVRAGGREPAVPKTAENKHVGISDLLGVWSHGQYVWTTVTVNGETQRMAKGEIVGIHSGYCDVDVMSLHVGAPWIQQHTNSSLEPVICKACECKVDKDGCGCNPADA